MDSRRESILNDIYPDYEEVCGFLENLSEPELNLLQESGDLAFFDLSDPQDAMNAIDFIIKREICKSVFKTAFTLVSGYSEYEWDIDTINDNDEFNDYIVDMSSCNSYISFDRYTNSYFIIFESFINSMEEMLQEREIPCKCDFSRELLIISLNTNSPFKFI